MFKFLGSLAIAVGCFFALILVAAGLFLATTPRPTNLKGCLTTEWHHVHLCAKDPNYVRLRDISQNARNAAIVSEDGAFYSHHGFDWDELHKSIDKNMAEKTYARGGSTITQQLAKNVYLSGEKSVFRKIKEAMITVQIEKLLTKDEILEKYLNVVEYGDKLYGIKPATNFYFHKSPAELTPAEGAFLAFLLPNPKKYSQSFRQKQLTKFAGRQVRSIVDRLFSFKKINETAHESALAQVDSMFGKDDYSQPANEPLDQSIDALPDENQPEAISEPVDANPPDDNE